MGGWEESVAWSLVVVSSMAYAFKVVFRPPQEGSAQQNLLALLPLLPIFIYVPWLPSSCHIRTLFSMVFLWTAPSKLLLLCFNSPLDPSSWISSGFSHFFFTTLLPIRVCNNSQSQRKKQQSYTHLTLSLLILILNSYLFLPPLPPPLLYLLYCIHFYLALELVLNCITYLFSAYFSVALLPSFDRPFLSASLSEFWGRRWNIMINGVLRATVYEPLLSVLTGTAHRLQESQSKDQAAKRREQLLSPTWARTISTLATFAVSGLMHEVIFVYVAKSKPTGEMIAFFVLHGIATVSEIALKKACAGSIKLPRSILVLFTIIFNYITVSFFFLRPIRRSGLDLQAIAEYHQLQNAVVFPFQRIFQLCSIQAGTLTTEFGKG